MKTTLGRYALLFTYCFLLFLKAEDFSYTIISNKKDVYINEPILLSVDLNQTNPNTILLFHFKVNKSKDYKVVQLEAKYDDTFHHLKHHNLYEIFPLHAGDINVTFTLVKRVTDIDKVRYFSSGDRDDFKKLETTDLLVNLHGVQLHVKPLPKEVKLVGDFKLEYNIDTHSTKAFSPISWKITLKGVGYTPLIKNIIPKSTKYKIFREKPLIEKYSTSKGMVNSVTYLFAISSQKSYTIPNIDIKAFSPTTHKTYTLSIPKQNFKIQSIDKSSLVDKHNYPKPSHIDWSFVISLVKYIFVFFVGYLSANILKWKQKDIKRDINPLEEKIKDTKTEKSLLQLLMSQEKNKRFTKVIEKLETSLYTDKKTPLKTLKKEALENIK